MRKLLYIPIIHDQSDLGSLGPVLENMSSSQVGKGRWGFHGETVASFWTVIEEFLGSMDARMIRIYQDGLAAEGELGRKVIEEAAKRGSLNHRILLALISQGAEIRVTENISLLLEEARQLFAAVRHESEGTDANPAEYEERKQWLTEQRDRFVADRINTTLKQGETGVLLMGANHDVLPHLARDIIVQPVKDRGRVSAYFRELLEGQDQDKLEHMAAYLTSPV